MHAACLQLLVQLASFQRLIWSAICMSPYALTGTLPLFQRGLKFNTISLHIAI